MKNLLTPSRTLALSILLGCGTGQAQMLGTAVAEPLLGKPLQVTVPARFASGDAGDQCVHAEVFYGESRVRASDVRTTITGPADQRRVRVEADAPIDEPVVTVSLRAGCRNTVTRNYTLLPEYPSERLLAALETRTALAARAAAAPLQLAASPAPASLSPRRAAPRPVTVARAATTAADTVPARSPRTSRAFRNEAVAAGPRLRLEPLERPEGQAVLRVSASLAEPNGDAARRAAAAMLWQAINADPQEVLRTTVLLQKLEQDLAQLRQNATQTRAEMAALRQRLDAAQPWYQSPVVAQVLALLLLAAASAGGVLWFRARQQRLAAPAWYAPSEAAPVTGSAAAVAELPAAEPETVVVAPDAAQPVDVPLPEAPVSVATAPSAVHDGTIDFELATPEVQQPAARSAVDGMLRVETLAATFEEVEFLTSLGLAGDAMDLLKTYLQDSASPAPIAFLELMRLCDQAGDAMAVATIRRRYAQLYGVEVPRLPQVVAPTGVEAMPELSARIVAAWGRGEALDRIEQALFAVPTPGNPLTLQAGRDLLCLYDLSMTLLTDAAVPPAGHGAEAHPLAPWAQAEDAAPAPALADAAAPSGLDVDLTQPAPLEAVRLPAVEGLDVAAAARAEAQRRAQEEEEAFDAAVASERVPASRY